MDAPLQKKRNDSDRVCGRRDKRRYHVGALAKKEPHASVGRSVAVGGFSVGQLGNLREKEGRKEPFKGANNIQQQPEINHAMSFRLTLRVRERD